MKMTSQRISRLRNKIIDSRTRLMEENPFFSLLLMHLRFYATNEISTASTDGENIFFSPSYIDKLYGYEVDYLLCHLIMHIVFDDISRESDLEGNTYHHACDIVNNDVLSRCGYAKKRYPHLGEIQRKIPFERYTDEIDANMVYTSLMYKMEWFPENVIKRLMIDTDTFWNKEYFDYEEMILISEPDKDYLGYGEKCSYREVKEDNDAEWEPDDKEGNDDGEGKKKVVKNGKGKLSGVVQSVLKLMKDEIGAGKLAGTESLLSSREMIKVKKPKTDWRTLLDSFIQEEVCDYSFSPPDRRYTDSPFFLPDFNDTDVSAKDILFMVDSSGSMSTRDISVAFEEIKNAVEQFNGKLNGWIGFFDADVVPPRPFSSVEDINKIFPSGGGGTDFDIIFDYINTEMTDEPPSSIVIMTDGYASFPENEVAKGIPVLWLINNTEITPPWGKCIRFDGEKENNEYEW